MSRTFYHERERFIDCLKMILDKCEKHTSKQRKFE